MKVKLPNVRLAFPQLFRATTFAGEANAKPSFSASFIFPKDHPAVADLKAAIKAVAEEKWGAKAPEILKAMQAKDALCLHNGDSKADYEGFAGNLYVSSRSPTRPTVLDRDKSELTESSGKPYAGCYVNAIIDVWAQDNIYGKRVNASPAGVQFREDGDAFAGGQPASEDDFDDLGTAGGTPNDIAGEKTDDVDLF